MSHAKYINEARLKACIREQLNSIRERFAGMLRTNLAGEEWTYDDNFLHRTGILLDGLVEELSFLVLERASQRCRDTANFTVIKQDVLDAFDMYRASKKE